jgi:hypothetical protein
VQGQNGPHSADFGLEHRRFHDLADFVVVWRQGFGEWLFPLQSPFSTAGFPATLEAAATGGSTEESSSLILL